MADRTLVITAVRDEGPNLIHWIAHNRAAGMDAHLVFSNDCSDGTDTLLDRLAAAGVLTHVRNAVPEGRTPQWAALKQATTHPETLRADWIAVIDCDEYVALRPPLDTVRDLIARAGADAIVLPWRLFGNAGHVDRPDLSPTRAYTRAIPTDALFPPLSRFFKTLYRRDAFRAPGVHRPKPGRAPATWVDGSGTVLPRAFAEGRQIMLWGEPIAADLVQLNHYSVRSVADFIAKAARGLPNHADKPVDLTYWIERNFNTVRDDSILRAEPATEAEACRLRALPGVAEAEDRSRAWHKARFAVALTEPGPLKLYGRVLMAPDSRVPDRDTALRLVDLYRRAAGQTAP